MGKVLVVGQSGQLASEIKRMSASRGDSYQFIGKEQLNGSDFGALASIIASEKPDTVVNCAGYTAVDKAESDPDESFRLNRDLPARLASLGANHGFHLVHFSTDYVFDGDATAPYSESASCQPKTVYGRSKLEGERAVLGLAKSVWVVRTSWLYSIDHPSFLKTMLRLADQPNPLRVVDDQIGSPTWTRDLAQFVCDSLLTRTSRAELLHFSGGGQTTWCGFAREIMSVWAKNKEIVAISTSEYPTAAQRPRYSVLSKAKAENEFGMRVRDWRDSLKACHSAAIIDEASKAKGDTK